jgi:hypothetical protein
MFSSCEHFATRAHLLPSVLSHLMMMSFVCSKNPHLHSEDVLLLCDNEAVLCAIKKWVGQGGKAMLATAPDADILREIVCLLTQRVQARRSTFLIKVKSQRGELINERADTLAEEGREIPDDDKRWDDWMDRRESVLFIGTQFNNLYNAVDTPARGRVVVCLVFVCKYVLGHSRVSQPLNLQLCLLRHLGFLTSPHASPTYCRRRLNSYRLLRRSTPGPPPIPWAHLFHLPDSPRPPLYTPTMTT